jgi:ferredoxin
MAYKITNDCISCGACADECKNDAISEGKTIYVINPDKCTECVGYHMVPMCAEICPMEACVPDPDHHESKEQLLGKWHALHPGGTPLFVL